MAELAQVTRYRIDLDQVTPQRPAKSDLYQGDVLANEIALELYRNGESQSMDGYTASGEMTRADGNRVPCEGNVEGHVVTITLNEHCYVVAGDYELAVTISGDGAKRTLLKLKGTVQARGDGAIVDINETLVDVDAVLELYGSMQEGIKKTEQASKEASEAAAAAEEATGAAQGAAENADKAAERAEDAAAYIEGATFDAEQLPAGSMPTISTTDEDGHMHATFGIPQGEQGKPYTIKGSAFATLAQLQAGVPDPEEGDLYNVGTAPPYNIYRWTGSAWEDQGKVQGGQGEPGEKGDKPIKGVDYWTEEDKAEIVEEVIESTKGQLDDNLDLLWSNINHSTAFAAQVLSLPALADYKIIAIRFKGYIQFTEYSPLILYQADDTRTIGTVVSATTENIFARPVTINKAAQTVTFGSGSKNGDTMAYNDNNFAIPVEIYGVRWGGGGSGGGGSSGGGASDETVEELAQSIEEVRAIANRKADAFDVTAKGEMVAVQDAVAAPAVKLTSYIEPVQNADSGISGWNSVELQTFGKNILLRSGNLPLTRNGVVFTDVGDGKISVKGTATAAANFSIRSYSAGARTRIAAGTYTLTGGDENAKITLIVYASQDATDSIASATSVALTQGAESVFTVPAGGGYFGVYVTVAKDKTADCVLEPKIETGAVDTGYEPYSVMTVTAELPETVYKGTLDWVTGTATSTADASGNDLEEPRLMQITPRPIILAKGKNTFQSNTGDTELVYAVDTKLYIDHKFATLAAAILRL